MKCLEMYLYNSSHSKVLAPFIITSDKVNLCIRTYKMEAAPGA